jgi:hypothetical protein
MKNMLYSEENSSKLCAEGAIGDLMNMLYFWTEGINLFWEPATSNLSSIIMSLNKSNVPKKGLNQV